jgi:hypothetical protein
MALRFISHKEIAFRQLLGMLRSPPVAVMSYYTNLFLSARFVFGEQPEKIRFLDKEIRRVECMVGVRIDVESDKIQQELAKIQQVKYLLENERQRLEAIYDGVDEAEQKEVEDMFRDVSELAEGLERKEYFLLYKLTPLMNLKEIETYMDNNFDLKSFFKEHGKTITQMELNAELEKIKIWVYQEAVEMMPYIRFTKLE